ncbi:prepilin peptidase [Luteolibacter pohnpeiensis]|uniref:Prepilin peptidase n=1 Tax=Luteolibacter pohnpeiensis TaxID=454153 RepID=A0A934SAY3_9BACT|nr:A24 family peptidase [Luteolibacter pohnpeiensis]MBK1882564.1 prepilin peptidase [Luteolibacter pohnpeiensis]
MIPTFSLLRQRRGLNGDTLPYGIFDLWIWLIPAFLLGACIGSFLNVVIYRVPLGLSVNEPKRSFCPHCKKPIPMGRNIPLFSWLLLRGKCADCGAPIAFRYFAVELLTALLFMAAWWFFTPQVVVFLWVLLALLIAITFIDAEHMIIPISLTWSGVVVGLIASVIYPVLPDMAGNPMATWKDGLKHAGIGWVTGFIGLWLVVELGKLVFGKRAMKFEKPVEWFLKEPEGDQDPMLFVIDGEEIAWWDIFYRKTDRLIVEATDIRVDGVSVGEGKLVIREVEIELPDGSTRHLAKMKSLDGKALSTVIPREAMGMGDVHLLGMIGVFFGCSGVFFSLFAACIFALVAALFGKIGFGRQLPFGPFLALGAVTWMFGGWMIWAWYLNFLIPG